MSFLSKIQARAKSLTLWRYVNDVYPSDVNHFYPGDGVYGKGTYFSLDDRSKKHLDGERYSLNYTYKAEPKNTLILTPKVIDGLDDATDMIVEEEGLLGNKAGFCFDASKLTSLAKKNNFDSISITGSPHLEGGQQLIALRDFPLTVKSVTVCFQSKTQRDKVHTELDRDLVVRKAGNHWDIVDVPPGLLKKLDAVLRK